MANSISRNYPSASVVRSNHGTKLEPNSESKEIASPKGGLGTIVSPSRSPSKTYQSLIHRLKHEGNPEIILKQLNDVELSQILQQLDKDIKKYENNKEADLPLYLDKEEKSNIVRSQTEIKQLIVIEQGKKNLKKDAKLKTPKMCEDIFNLYLKGTVKFANFVKVIKGVGFRYKRTKGSHSLYVHPDIVTVLNLQNTKNREAKYYQVSQFFKALNELIEFDLTYISIIETTLEQLKGLTIQINVNEIIENKEDALNISLTEPEKPIDNTEDKECISISAEDVYLTEPEKPIDNTEAIVIQLIKRDISKMNKEELVNFYANEFVTLTPAAIGIINKYIATTLETLDASNIDGISKFTNSIIQYFNFSQIEINIKYQMAVQIIKKYPLFYNKFFNYLNYFTTGNSLDEFKFLIEGMKNKHTGAIYQLIIRYVWTPSPLKSKVNTAIYEQNHIHQLLLLKKETEAQRPSIISEEFRLYILKEFSSEHGVNAVIFLRNQIKQKLDQLAEVDQNPNAQFIIGYLALAKYPMSRTENLYDTDYGITQIMKGLKYNQSQIIVNPLYRYRALILLGNLYAEHNTEEKTVQSIVCFKKALEIALPNNIHDFTENEINRFSILIRVCNKYLKCINNKNIRHEEYFIFFIRSLESVIHIIRKTYSDIKPSSIIAKECRELMIKMVSFRASSLRVEGTKSGNNTMLESARRLHLESVKYFIKSKQEQSLLNPTELKKILLVDIDCWIKDHSDQFREDEKQALIKNREFIQRI